MNADGCNLILNEKTSNTLAFHACSILSRECPVIPCFKHGQSAGWNPTAEIFNSNPHKWG